MDEIKQRSIAVNRNIVMMAVFLTLQLLSQTLYAGSGQLTSVDYSVLPGDKAVIKLALTGEMPVPTSFTTDNPARIAIDLPGISASLDKRNIGINSGFARSVNVAEAAGRTRVVITLTQLVPYELRSENDAIYINLQPPKQAKAGGAVSKSGQSSGVTTTIDRLDFRRGTNGEGLVAIDMNNSSAIVDTQTVGDKIQIDFLGVGLPEKLERRLDVTDFATPVNSIDAYQMDGRTRVIINASGIYDYMAYQAGEQYRIEVKTITEIEKVTQEGDGSGFTGEKLSLNFQNIEVRAVLQLVADFTGLNIVASDTVSGNITLRLKNVPWDQALDIILKTRGLGMRKTGNVVLIAPNKEIADREKSELEAEKQKSELVPLKTAYFTVNYAKASEIANILKKAAGGATMLSARGNVTVDERTNILMVQDTAEQIEQMAAIIKKLDVPIRQVLIESRIVVANDDFSRSLGVQTGVTAARAQGNGAIMTTGTGVGTDVMTGSAVDNINTTGQPFPLQLPSLDQRYNVSLPSAGSSGQVAVAVLGADYLVDLELTALQQEGRGEVVSNPRVITSNQKRALIEQGVEIPYQEASASGATSVSFKKAVLKLEVTPQITPDDRVVMDLKVSKDSAGQVVGGIPTINTRNVETQVLVDNGDTVVLGGIYEQSRSNDEEKVPLLGDIPLLGALFRTNSSTDKKAELLIFVTPKILKEGLQAGY